VFPPGEIEFKHSPGPNWKSLCQPAILPLTTDYLPSSDMLTRDYTEGIYTITLPDMDDPTVIKTFRCVCVVVEASPVCETPGEKPPNPTDYVMTCRRSHSELLQEMVCQRLTQDFQLVEKLQAGPSATYVRACMF
jgi:hypothetical protein